MSGYTIQATCEQPFEAVVASVRAELAKAGFGVITEIDLSATLREKIGAEIPAEVILGACNPRYAHRAISADPSVAALLPCNVVVRSLGERSTLLEAFDPATMMQMGGHDDLAGLAAEVGQQLRAALGAVESGSHTASAETREN
jgi:uncharacterized protein (DUF302 family)